MDLCQTKVIIGPFYTYRQIYISSVDMYRFCHNL